VSAFKDQERVPLPRRRRESQDDEAMRPKFAFDFDDTTNLEAYVDILTSLSDTVPDATTARERPLKPTMSMRERESAQNTDTTVNQWNILHFHQKNVTTHMDAKTL